MTRHAMKLGLLALALSLVAAAASSQSPDEDIAVLMDAINAQLELDGASYRLGVAEYITADPDAQGNTIIARDVGNKRLGAHFVPGDARRVWSGPGANSLTYAIDTTGDAVPFFGGLSAAQTDAAITRAHGTWEALACSNLGQARNPDFGIDIGLVAFLNGLGGSPFVFADVQHAGWRDINFAGGIIGATFTFIFVSGGVLTDIDNDGRLDTAFREIYYDPSFNWADDGTNNVDVETVALHEIGHGLSQAHFGKVFLDNKGNLKFAPEAVMNAVYVGPRRGLLGTDNGGHCGNWGSWPNN